MTPISSNDCIDSWTIRVKLWKQENAKKKILWEKAARALDFLFWKNEILSE